jgi:hypothetical protein
VADRSASRAAGTACTSAEGGVSASAGLTDDAPRRSPAAQATARHVLVVTWCPSVGAVRELDPPKGRVPRATGPFRPRT